MGNAKAKKRSALYIPAVTLIAIVMILLVLIAISTYRNLNRERMRMEEHLMQQGSIIIRSLEAGARASMMDMMTGAGPRLQSLIEELSRETLLRSISVFDRKGVVVAHSDPKRVGQVETDLSRRKFLFESRASQATVVLSSGPDVLEMGTLLVLAPLNSALHQGSHSMMGLSPAPEQYAIVVSLRMDPIRESAREDLHHALIMGGILFALGSASIFFIFVVYHLTITRRTLDSVEAYNQQLVRKMPEGLVGIDSKGNITSMNVRAMEMFHLPSRLPASLAITDLIPCAGAELMDRLTKDGEVIDWEIECSSHGEPLPLALSAAVLPEDETNATGAVLILRDMRQIRELQRQVQQRERLAALGSLAAGVAHEIRNPLTALRGLAQYFQKGRKPGSLDYRYSEVMVAEVDRLNRVVTGLLDYARPRDLILSDTDLVALVQHVFALIHGDAMAKGVKLDFTHDDVMLLMPLDPDQISQALLNIMLNSLAAMPQGGKLEVRLRHVKGKEAQIVVSDTGCGIPESDIPRLFDPFFTTKPKGSGLGLAIVHRVVESHRGRIKVESRVGKGTRVTLSLPLVQDKQTQGTTLKQQGNAHGSEVRSGG